MTENAPPIDLSTHIAVPMTLGQALFMWETLSTHFSDLNNHPNLSEPEKKALWGLTDLLEESLVRGGIHGGLSDYQSLVKHAEFHLQNTLAVDFVDN